MMRAYTNYVVGYVCCYVDAVEHPNKKKSNHANSFQQQRLKMNLFFLVTMSILVVGGTSHHGMEQRCQHQGGGQLTLLAE